VLNCCCCLDAVALTLALAITLAIPLAVAVSLAVAIALALTVAAGQHHAAGTPSPLRPCPPLPASALGVAVNKDHHRRR
jgi:hypothetical protein